MTETTPTFKKSTLEELREENARLNVELERTLSRSLQKEGLLQDYASKLKHRDEEIKFLRKENQELKDKLNSPVEDYKGFVLEFEERMNKGLPVDLSILREMAKKYNTPILG